MLGVCDRAQVCTQKVSGLWVLVFGPNTFFGIFSLIYPQEEVWLCGFFGLKNHLV